jgi:hypothetical protein
MAVCRSGLESGKVGTALNESLPLENQKLICLSPRVMEQIESLRKTGTMGVLLAGKAEAIICRLKSGEAWQADRKVAPHTAHGEKRIRKCIKYDLGWGFRLITVLRHDCLFICYLGPHDECDRWLADNSRLKEVEFGSSALYRVAPQQLTNSTTHPGDPSEAVDDLDKRLQELPDQFLRRIFCGLVESRKRHRASIGRGFNEHG